MGVSRVMVRVGDIEAAAWFYGRVLGIRGDRVSDVEHGFDCGEFVLVCDGSRSDGSVSGGGGGGSRVRVVTDDLNGVRRRLVAELGERGVGPFEDQPTGERAVEAADPWGNRLCFVDRATVRR